MSHPALAPLSAIATLPTLPILSKRASSKCASPSSATVISSSNTNDCSDTRLAQWPGSEDAVAGPRSGGYNQEVEVIYFVIPILTELKPKLASPDGFSKYQRIPISRLDESRSHRTIELTTTREMGSVGIMYARASRLLHNIVPVRSSQPLCASHQRVSLGFIQRVLTTVDLSWISDQPPGTGGLRVDGCDTIQHLVAEHLFRGSFEEDEAT